MSERPAEIVEAEEKARKSQSIETNREGFRKTITQYVESLRSRVECRTIQSYTSISTLLEEGRKSERFHYSIGTELTSSEDKAAKRKILDSLEDFEFYSWMKYHGFITGENEAEIGQQTVIQFIASLEETAARLGRDSTYNVTGGNQDGGSEAVSKDPGVTLVAETHEVTTPKSEDPGARLLRETREAIEAARGSQSRSESCTHEAILNAAGGSM